MYKIKQSKTYNDWFNALKDIQSKARIQARIRRIEMGNLGDFKNVGDNILEFRLFFGTGYRIYAMQHGAEIIILLIGGDKSSKSAQQNDINTASQMAKEIRKIK